MDEEKKAQDEQLKENIQNEADGSGQNSEQETDTTTNDDSVNTDEVQSEETSDESASAQDTKPETSSEASTESIADDSESDISSAPVSDGSTLSEEARADLAAKVSAQQSEKKSKPWVAILLALMVLVLLAGGTAYYWFVVRDSATVTTQTEKTKQEIDLIRYGAGEGTMNSFAPTLDDSMATLFLNKQIFEGLVKFENQTKIVPALAKSWTNPDSKTWLFELKDNVKFHSGNTLTAKDVAYSYEQTKLNETYASTVTGTIESLEAVGENQVKIVTKEVDPILLNRLVNMFVVDSTSAGKSDPSYGTGPYTLKGGTTPTDSSIELVAFDGYHGGKVYVKEFHMNVYYDSEEDGGALAEDQMLSDLKAGKLEIAGFLTAERLADAEKTGYSTFTTESSAVYQIGFGTKIKNLPVANAKVRQAIYQSVDVPALLKAIGREDTGEEASQLLTQYIPGYDSSITRPARDIVAAKKLLAEAGYPNGTKITLNVFSAAKEVGDELVRQLAEAGITVTLKVYDDPEKFLEDNDAGTQEAYYLSLGTDFGDASDVFSYALQTNNYSSEEIDQLIQEADSTIDQAKRLATLKQISKAAMDDTAVAPLYTNNSTWALAKPYMMTQDLLSADLSVYIHKIYLEN